MWLWIEPLDVLLFRDSRPFTGGESHRARSLFPPSPLTFQGALRGRLLEAALQEKGKSFTDYRGYLKRKALSGAEEPNDSELEEVIQKLGDTQSVGKLQIKGPFVVRREAGEWKPYFPVPFDVLCAQDSGNPIALFPISFAWEVPPQWDESWPSVLQPLWSDQEAAEEATGYWLTEQGMQDYLLGIGYKRAADPQWLEKSGHLYEREQRAGIRLKPGTRTVEQGMLYMAEFLRLEKNVGFVVEVSLDGNEDEALSPLKQEGLLALGGESRAARYELVDDPLKQLKELKAEVKGKVQDQRGQQKPVIKLYLAAPVIFSQGWKPDFLNHDLVGTVNGTGLKLVAAAIGKPLPLGGWDLALGRPKPLRWAVPPGSVYYFQVEQGQAEQVVDAFHFTCCLQGLAGDQGVQELAKVGFGLTFVGVAEMRELKG